jgi:AraC-like DNA-binding protein
MQALSGIRRLPDNTMLNNDLGPSPEVSQVQMRQAELVDLVARFAPTDGLHDTAIAPLQLLRASATTQALPSVCEPGLCVVVQGCKQAMLAGQVFRYDPLNYLVISVTLPIVAQILEATPQKPYLCVRLTIDPREIGGLLLEAGVGESRVTDAEPGLHVSRVSAPLLDAVLRLLELLRVPHDVPVLAPLAIREIYYRVLTGGLGPRLREIAVADSYSQRIARAVDLLKQRYAEPVRIEEVAEAVHMSASSLHHHFKLVTAMSPLQFQKQLRLHQARRLMLTEGIDAAAAGHRVGYESPSHFSREYRRLFGAPPKAEIAQMRNVVQA